MSVVSRPMQVIDLSELQPGSVLPTPIYDASNPALLLLGAGTQLTVQNLTRLKSRGITQGIVDAEHAQQIAPKSTSETQKSPEVPAPKPITADEIRKGGNKPMNAWIGTPKLATPTAEQTQRFQESRTGQQQELQSTLKSINQGLVGKTSKLQSLALDSCEMMLEDLDLFVKLSIDCQEDIETSTQSLRTAQLAMAIAAILGKSCDNINDLGVGCLIARAGQTETVKELILSPRPLTDAEWLEVKKTPSRTNDLVEKCPDVRAGARQVAYQMFERWDGSGYPRGRVGTQIHPLSRIASVADTYVALTSGRSHRAPFSPYKAVEIILQDTRKGMFDPQAVRGLLQTVCLYPVGSRVQLSDQTLATVIRTKTQAYDCPIVQVTHNSEGEPVSPKILDLEEHEGLTIVEVFESNSEKTPHASPA